MGEEFEGKWIYVYVWLSPIAIHLKQSQHCLSTDYTLIQNKSLKFFLKKAKGDGKKPGDEGAGDEI